MSTREAASDSPTKGTIDTNTGPRAARRDEATGEVSFYTYSSPLRHVWRKASPKQAATFKPTK